MKVNHKQNVQSNINEIFNLLFLIESIIKMTHKVCLSKEMQAVYYDLSKASTFILSEERNHYINMLNLALDKLTSLKELNNRIENELYYLK